LLPPACEGEIIDEKESKYKHKKGGKMAADAKSSGAQGSVWTSFLKSIATFSGDLSNLTAPPFILSPVSLTEFPAYWCEHPELFAAIVDGKTPEDRAIRVLKWFIVCFVRGLSY